jgi:hypothetical protein
MVFTLEPSTEKKSNVAITWEALPENFVLEEESVESTAQPLIAGALRESLELTGYIQPTMLIASNLGLCATIDDKLAIKAPDWLYVRTVLPLTGNDTDRRSYTPNLEGEVPQVVMEFLSDTDGNEYSAKPTFPPGKWYFYEQILHVPIYITFEPVDGYLEVYSLGETHYQLQPKDPNNRYWIAVMGLFLGVWQGEKEGRRGYWLRWWDRDGNLLPWSVELLEQERQSVEQERQRADQEQQRADQERQRADQEQQRAERLVEQLRLLGITPID